MRRCRLQAYRLAILRSVPRSMVLRLLLRAIPAHMAACRMATVDLLLARPLLLLAIQLLQACQACRHLQAQASHTASAGTLQHRTAQLCTRRRSKVHPHPGSLLTCLARLLMDLCRQQQQRQQSRHALPRCALAVHWSALAAVFQRLLHPPHLHLLHSHSRRSPWPGTPCRHSHLQYQRSQLDRMQPRRTTALLTSLLQLRRRPLLSPLPL